MKTNPIEEAIEALEFYANADKCVVEYSHYPEQRAIDEYPMAQHVAQKAIANLRAYQEEQKPTPSDSELVEEIKRIERLYKGAKEFAESEARKCHQLYTALAPFLGLKPYYGTFNKEQTIWAKSQAEADALMAGENIFKYVDEALKPYLKGGE